VIILAIVLAALWIPKSEAQQSNPIPKHQAASKPDERGTKENPFSVDIVRTAEADGSSPEQQKDRKKKKVIDGITIGILSLQTLIFLLQLIAFTKQVGWMKKTVVEMEKGTIATLGIATTAKENSGQTPAKNLVQWARTGFALFPKAAPPPPAGNRENKASTNVVAPGGEIYSTTEFNRRMTAHEIDGLRKNEVALYVIGEIHYTDAFGENRWSKYKLFANGASNIENGMMAACEDGNDYT
jgi:hypothetical protein